MDIVREVFDKGYNAFTFLGREFGLLNRLQLVILLQEGYQGNGSRGSGKGTYDVTVEHALETGVLFVQETNQELVPFLIRVRHKLLQRRKHTNNLTT